MFHILHKKNKADKTVTITDNAHTTDNIISTSNESELNYKPVQEVQINISNPSMINNYDGNPMETESIDTDTIVKIKNYELNMNKNELLTIQSQMTPALNVENISEFKLSSCVKIMANQSRKPCELCSMCFILNNQLILHHRIDAAIEQIDLLRKEPQVHATIEKICHKQTLLICPQCM